MPYFVYRFLPDNANKPLELEETYDSYRDAKQHVKGMREENPDEDLNNFRMAFAETKAQARALLTTKRAKQQIEEWEA